MLEVPSGEVSIESQTGVSPIPLETSSDVNQSPIAQPDHEPEFVVACVSDTDTPDSEAIGCCWQPPAKSSEQRRLSTLMPEERKQFEEAQEGEISNWLKTGTVSFRFFPIKLHQTRFCGVDGH